MNSQRIGRIHIRTTHPTPHQTRPNQCSKQWPQVVQLVSSLPVHCCSSNDVVFDNVAHPKYHFSLPIPPTRRHRLRIQRVRQREKPVGRVCARIQIRINHLLKQGDLFMRHEREIQRSIRPREDHVRGNLAACDGVSVGHVNSRGKRKTRRGSHNRRYRCHVLKCHRI